MTYSLTTDKVGMRGIDVARLHVNKIFHELVCWVHGLLEEVDNDKMELFLELRISSEKLCAEQLS